MLCPKCAYDNSDGAMFCASCGATLEFEIEIEENEVIPAAVNSDVDPQPVDEAPVQPVMSLNTQGEVKKKSPKVPILIGIGVIVVALIVLLVLNFNKWFGPKSDPRDQLNQALKTGINTAFDDMDAALSILSSSEQTSAAVSGTMKLEINDSLLQSIPDLDPQMLAMIQGITMDYTSTENDGKFQLDCALKVEGVELMAVTVAADLDTGELFFSLPGKSQQALRIPTTEYPVSEYSTPSAAIPGMLMSLISETPDVFRPIVLRYLEIIVNGLTSVESKTETVTVEGISQELTVLTCTLTEADAKDILVKIVETAKSDEDIKALIFAFADYFYDFSGGQAEMKPETVYESFVTSMEQALQDMEELSVGSESISFEVLLSGDKLAGFRFDAPDATGSISIASVENGGKFASRFVIGPLEIVGSGENKDGMTGEYIVRTEGKEAFSIGFKNFIVTDDKASGMITLRLGKDMLEELADNLGASIPAASLAMLSPTLELEFNETEGKSGFSIGLRISGLEMLSISTEYAPVDPVTINLPKDYVDYYDTEALEQWLKDVGLYDVIMGLSAATGGTASYL